MNKVEKKALEKEFREQTVALLDIIWTLSDAMTVEDLARESGVSKATIIRLWGGAWQRPQILTLQKLCRVVGLEIILDRTGSMKTRLEVMV